MNFLTIPNIPNDTVTHMVIDSRISERELSKLEKYNITFIKTPICDFLYNEICGHPDILVHHLGNNNIVICKNLINSNFANILSKLNLNVICGNTSLSSTYPFDIAYNVARINNIAIHNSRYTDKVIKDYFIKNNISVIHTNQGYSKCSICILSDNAIITQDFKIYNKLVYLGFKCLLIRPGLIRFPDNSIKNGFIGGCTGLIAPGKLVVTGDLYYHPDYYSIKSFLHSNNIETITLSDSAPIDYGSFVPIITK